MRQKIVLLIGGLFVLALVAFPLLAPAGAVRRHPTAALLPSSTPIPTSTATTTPTPIPPTPTPQPWTFPADSEVAGVAVGGLTSAEARATVAAELAQLNRPLRIHAANHEFTINAGDMLTLPAVDTLINQASRAGRNRAVKLPLHAQINRQQILDQLEHERAKIAIPAATTVLSDAKALTQTFTFAARPGLTLDLPTAADRIATALTDSTVTSVTLTTSIAVAPRPKLGELEQVLEQQAALWHGVTGLYVYDTMTGEAVGYHDDTVFSGASVMKVPIMIFAYARLGTLNEQQREWLRLVINESKNIEANNLLAAAVGGSTTDDALVGASQMSDMLRNLGLKHTYMIIPYESGDYLIQNSKLPGGGPPQEGSPPFTDADAYVRTTPNEMGHLFVMLAQCSEGRGPLIEKYGEHLNAVVCKEMLNQLRTPHDQSRMVAGIPAGIPVAHKGGWTEDFQGDVGIVDAPSGQYVAAIYIYRSDKDGYVSDADANPSPYLGDFSHTIYTFFNPVPLDQGGHVAGSQASQP